MSKHFILVYVILEIRGHQTDEQNVLARDVLFR